MFMLSFVAPGLLVRPFSENGAHVYDFCTGNLRPAPIHSVYQVGSAASYYLDIVVDVGTKFGDKELT